MTKDEDRAHSAQCIACLAADDAPATAEGFTNSKGVRFEAIKPIFKYIKASQTAAPCVPTHAAAPLPPSLRAADPIPAC